jgi:hypothetical protein
LEDKHRLERTKKGELELMLTWRTQKNVDGSPRPLPHRSKPTK